LHENTPFVFQYIILSNNWGAVHGGKAPFYCSGPKIFSGFFRALLLQKHLSGRRISEMMKRKIKKICQLFPPPERLINRRENFRRAAGGFAFRGGTAVSIEPLKGEKMS
jgi:hypothetical protein